MSAEKATKVTTFAMDERMTKALEELREYLGASSNAEVLRRSVAFMKFAVDSADDQKRVIIKNSHDETMQRVPLAI